MVWGGFGIPKFPEALLQAKGSRRLDPLTPTSSGLGFRV